MLRIFGDPEKNTPKMLRIFGDPEKSPHKRFFDICGYFTKYPCGRYVSRKNAFAGTPKESTPKMLRIFGDPEKSPHKNKGRRNFLRP